MTKRLVTLVLMVFAWTCTPLSAAETRVTWYGHATFEVVTPKGARLFIDPWLTNPKNPRQGTEQALVERLEGADYILLTHAHTDHIGNAVAIAAKTGAKLVAMPELGRQMVKLKGYPKEQFGMATMMNMGGHLEIAGGEVTVYMTDARHSSGMSNPFADADEKAPATVYAGNPAGFVVRVQDGPTIYHSGDTDYFGDMALIGERYAPDLALLCAGDHFTMGPATAARAAKAVGAKVSVPMHWGTFPILAQSIDPFVAEAERLGVATRVMKPGESLVYDGERLKP